VANKITALPPLAETILLIFEMADIVRRTQGEGLGLLGFGPEEADYRIVASGEFWRLRQYSGPGGGASVLIVAAPIKQPYIWDLSPSVSVVRHCLREGLRVHLLEWIPPSRASEARGVAEYADDAISGAVAAVTEEVGAGKPFLLGHSLGGTLAAIFAGLHPEQVCGLVLVSAPLCLHPGVSPFRDAIAAIASPWLAEVDIIPGSLLTQVSITMSPATFVWSRFLDAAASAGDSAASELRSRIERWALDEVPLSGKLAKEVLLQFYCENRLCDGTMMIHGQFIEPSCLTIPILAVMNTADEVAPPASVSAFLEAMAGADTRLVRYPGEAGVVLQHIGMLVGPTAFTEFWPEITDWIKCHS
jgi:polyhydroxyalkanoate synthase